MDQPITFAALFKARLEELGMTQVQLAVLLDRAGKTTTVQTLSAWHKGRSAPHRRRLNVLLDVLKVPAAYRDTWRAAAMRDGEEADDDATAPEAA